jgi:hypothetical protein
MAWSGHHLAPSRRAMLVCVLAFGSIALQLGVWHTGGSQMQSTHVPPLIPERGCPTAFIYNAPQNTAEAQRLGVGPPLGDAGGYLYNSMQHGAGAVLLDRYLSSAGRCSVTDDPRQAELFIVHIPLPPAQHDSIEAQQAANSQVFDFMAPAEYKRLLPACERFWTGDWARLLPHLTPRTAHRHIFVPLEYFDLASWCDGGNAAFIPVLQRNASWARLLARTPRVTTEIGPTTQQHRVGEVYGTSGVLGRQLLLTAPLVSSVHPRRVPGEQGPLPWAVRPRGARPILMSFGGSFEGMPRGVALRKLIAHKCVEYAAAHGNTTCRLSQGTGGMVPFEQANTLAAAFALKQQSIFCLEPPGRE